MTGHLTTADLAAQGFTLVQIKRLEALREAYPIIEFVTGKEWQRLRFLKWRYAHQPVLA
jgi:hypothetical protein